MTVCLWVKTLPFLTISQPFLKELIDLRDGSAFLSLVKTWGKNSQIPEEYYKPNLKTLRYHFLKYNKRGESSKKFYTKPSSQPSSLKFNLQKEPKIIKLDSIGKKIKIKKNRFFICT